MFRLAGHSLRGIPYRSCLLVASGLSAVSGTTLLSRSLLNEPKIDAQKEIYVRKESVLKKALDELKTYAWGGGPNSQNIIGSAEPLRFPTELKQLSGFAMRDVALHEVHAAAADASGDVYQWGAGFDEMTCTLKGQDIRKIAASSNVLFALSGSGQIFLLPSKRASLEEPQPSTWTRNFWTSSSLNNVLVPEGGLQRGEKFSSISAGRDHFLAVTTAGRTFAYPMNMNGNSHGQLGTRRIRVIDPKNSGSEAAPATLIPKTEADPFANASPFSRPPSPSTSSEIREPAKLLYEIPALRGVTVSQVVAGERSSYALTRDSGRVLAWGANEFGQLGLGGNITVPAVYVPTEVALLRSFPAGSSVKCLNIAAGGDAAYFTVESSSSLASAPTVDVFACGMGQFGALGNGLYSQAQGSPVRVKTISGKTMYDEAAGTVHSILPQAFSVSPTGHVLLSLSSGRDLLTWGSNATYQLGNGKRANVAIPMYMTDFTSGYPAAKSRVGVSEPSSSSSFAAGTESDGQNRTTLREGTLKTLRDMSGRTCGHNVLVQEWPVTGWKCSLVYWKILP